MIKYFISLLLFFTAFSVYSYQNLIDKVIDSHKVKIIQVVLDWHHKVVVSLSEKGESLLSLMNKVYWVSAINWAYFCPADYPNCWWKNYTNAPRFFEWKNYSRYWDDFWINWVFSFDKKWKPFLVMNYLWWDVPEELKQQINSDKIKDIYWWLWNFPVLLLEWNNLVSLYESELSRKMKISWPKAFICSTKDWKTIYMWYVSNITIFQMPEFLKKNFWCYNALNLDSWWSLWLIYNWKVIKKNWRPIMDAFVVVDSEKYNKIKEIIRKNSKIIDSVVSKIKDIYWKNPYVLKAIIQKIDQIKNKYSNNLKVFVLLNEIENRLEKLSD